MAPVGFQQTNRLSYRFQAFSLPCVPRDFLQVFSCAGRPPNRHGGPNSLEGIVIDEAA